MWGYILVGISGTLGAILRYLLGISFFTNSVFPFTTLFINLIGSFLLAWMTTRLFSRISLPASVTTAMGTGFVGSFTTFSTLSVETLKLFQSGNIGLGVLYVFVSIVGGLMMSRVGFKLSKEAQQS